MNKKIASILCLLMITSIAPLFSHGGHGWGFGYGVGLGLGLGVGYPGWGYGYGAYPWWGGYPYGYNAYYSNYPRYNAAEEAEINRNREREQYYRGRADAAKEYTRSVEKQKIQPSQIKFEKQKNLPKKPAPKIPTYSQKLLAEE